MKQAAAATLGVFLLAGLLGLGFLARDAVLNLRALDRSVVVKGLAEREVPADVAIWPIRFSEAGNDLAVLYEEVARKSELVRAFLEQHGFSSYEISVATPAVFDKQAQNYNVQSTAPFRYTASVAVTLYSPDTERVRDAMAQIIELGKQGIAIGGQEHRSQTQYLFTGLNELKPAMIEEATRNARLVAEKFARDSKSKLGKIKTARQGQFSIVDRDSNTPHIKKVRVVSTVEYYLTD